MLSVRCIICSKEFTIKPSHEKLGWGKFCSNDCKREGQKSGTVFNCSTCSKQIYRAASKIKRSKSRLFFCNKTCQTLWRNSLYIEKEHPNWVNGIRSYREIIKRSGAEKKCIHCNIDDERVLAVHHLDHDRTNNTVSNLVWMCMNCHFLIHSDK